MSRANHHYLCRGEGGRCHFDCVLLCTRAMFFLFCRGNIFSEVLLCVLCVVCCVCFCVVLCCFVLFFKKRNVSPFMRGDMRCDSLKKREHASVFDLENGECLPARGGVGCDAVKGLLALKEGVKIRSGVNGERGVELHHGGAVQCGAVRYSAVE